VEALGEEVGEDQANEQHDREGDVPGLRRGPARLEDVAKNERVDRQHQQRGEEGPQLAAHGAAVATGHVAPHQVQDQPAVGGETEVGRERVEETRRREPGPDGMPGAHRSASSRSRRRSPTSSMPTLRRTSESLMPRRARRSGGTEAWVITAGWLSRLSTPPSDSARVNSRVREQKRLAASKPPLSTTETMPPKPDICRAARACCGCDSRPG